MPVYILKASPIRMCIWLSIRQRLESCAVRNLCVITTSTDFLSIFVATQSSGIFSHLEVTAVLGPAGDFVGPVRTDGPGVNHVVIRVGQDNIRRNQPRPKRDLDVC